MINRFFIFAILSLLGAGVYGDVSEAHSASSPENGYTVNYPTGWQAARIYYRPDVFEDAIMEHVLLWNEARACISVDVWKSSISGDITLWLRVMDRLGIEQHMLEKITATQEKLDARLYRVFSKKQSYNSQMIFFKHQNKVFRISYWECDGGLADQAYRDIVDNFSFSVVGKPLGAMTQMSKDRVYSCGGVNDTCNCGMNNPYPCCDNDSNCTWWAWNQACCVWKIGLPSPWRNAKHWATDLSSHGYPVSSTPAVNTIACRDIGNYGHVAWVVEVSGTRVKVSEMNCCQGCQSGMRYHWYNISYFTGGYIYKK